MNKKRKIMNKKRKIQDGSGFFGLIDDDDETIARSKEVMEEKKKQLGEVKDATLSKIKGYASTLKGKFKNTKSNEDTIETALVAAFNAGKTAAMMEHSEIKTGGSKKKLKKTKRKNKKKSKKTKRKNKKKSKKKI